MDDELNCLRNTSKSAERRQRLIAAAKTLFAEHGFHRTGIAQISTLSGVKVGQIYRDFDSKEDIVAEIVQTGLADFMNEAALQRAIDSGDRVAVKDWVRRLVENEKPEQDKTLFPEIVAEAARNERAAAILRETDSQFREVMMKALRALAPDRDQAEIALAVETIMTLLIGFSNRRLCCANADVSLLGKRISQMIEREIGNVTGIEEEIWPNGISRVCGS